MKVLAYSDADVRGGAEQTLGTLVGALDPSIEIELAGTSNYVLEWIATRRPGTTIRVVPRVRNKFDISAMREHLSLVRDTRPDVLHVNLGTPWHGAYAVAAGLLTRGVRVVAVEHTPLPSRDPVQRFNKRRLVRRLDAYVACGRWLAEEMARQNRLPPSAVRVVHNGIEEIATAAVTDLPRGVVIGAIGRLHPDKGFDLLVRAAARLPDDVVVVIVGTGEEEERLRNLARELRVEDRVVITGWVEDALSYLRAFDVLALPSYREGFPLVTLEAMLAEIPVVATDVGGVAEAVRDGENGLLVEAGDLDALVAAAGALAADAELRNKLGARGRADVLDRFTARQMAERFEAIYTEILGR